jgi:hypothetical protein
MFGVFFRLSVGRRVSLARHTWLLIDAVTLDLPALGVGNQPVVHKWRADCDVVREGEDVMTLCAAWFPIVLALPFVCCAQNVRPDACVDPASVQQQRDARDWDAEERRCLQALDVATKEGRQPAVYLIYLGLASLHGAQHQHAEAEKYYQLAHNVAKAHFGDQTRQVMTLRSRRDMAATGTHPRGRRRISPGPENP